MQNPHWKHHIALAAVHAGLGFMTAMERGLMAAAPDIALAGVYLHQAFGPHKQVAGKEKSLASSSVDEERRDVITNPIAPVWDARNTENGTK